MGNIMNLTKLRNKVSRNGFDLSNKNLFTAKVGELLPVQCIECLPGDSFNIDTAWFTRTQPVNSAAYTRMREYYDWYFVPTTLLWNKFNTFVTQMVDNNQIANGINSNAVLTDEHPYFTTQQISNYLYTSNSYSLKNMFGFNKANLSVKLLHYLNYGDFSRSLSSQQVVVSNYRLNPFPLLAYQKIYQDYFRDSQWEKAYAPAFNLDYLNGRSGQTNIPLSDIEYNLENMFDLRYANWNKDYFMGLLPNSQFGESAKVLPDSNWQQELLVHSLGYQQLTSGSPLQIGSQTTTANGFPIYGVTAENKELFLTSLNRLSILAIRQANALQKWREITQSVGKDYKSQVSAHFNVDVSDAYSSKCQYLGGIAGNLDIQPVQNQNLTGDNDANIAGRGEGGNRGSINYDVKVHGYIMCIYHCVPLLDYALDGTKRTNLKTYVTDYAIPELDQTGMVQVPLVELHNTLFESGSNYSNTSLLGYAPRYIDYKTGYDLVHGAFYDGGLDSWVAPVNRHYIREYIQNLGATAAAGIFNYSFFKVPPSVVNPIFGINADSTNATDQLLINCSFDIKAVRNLDRNGLPY